MIKAHDRHMDRVDVVNLAANLSETSARSPGRLALRLDDRTMPYRQFDDASAQVVRWSPDP